MASDGYFSRRTFAFLRDLAENNQREWFQEHRSRYEEDVKGPAIRFILDFGPLLREISPHFRADPRTNGGSLFRIHRDTRFSRDKSPYKTHVGIQFRHQEGRDVHAPGFYLHVEPKNCFLGLGIWKPDGKTLRQIRERLVEKETDWRRALTREEFQTRFQLAGDSLKRPPRGFDPNHPLVEDLKRKDFIAVSPLSQATVTSPDLPGAFSEICRSGEDFIAFLCRALEVSF